MVYKERWGWEWDLIDRLWWRVQKTHQMAVERTTVSPFKKFHNEYRLSLTVLLNFKYQLTTTACIPQEGNIHLQLEGYLDQIGQWACLEDIVYWLRPLWVAPFPGQWILRCIRREKAELRVSTQHGHICLFLLLTVDAMLKFLPWLHQNEALEPENKNQISPVILYVAFVMIFWSSHWNLGCLGRSLRSLLG